MQKNLILLLLITSIPTLFASNERTVSVLMDSKIGRIEELGKQTSKTDYIQMIPCRDGLIHRAGYQNGVVNTILSGDKKIGYQYVFWKGHEVSSSCEFYEDLDTPGVIIHIHKKFLVYSDKEHQKIVPRGRQ